MELFGEGWHIIRSLRVKSHVKYKANNGYHEWAQGFLIYCVSALLGLNHRNFLVSLSPN